MILFNLLISIAYGDCLVDGVQFDIGGRAGSGVTAVDHSNPITLTEIKGWDIRGDDVSTCDVSSLTDLEKAFFSQRNFNQDIGSWDVRTLQIWSLCFKMQELLIKILEAGIHLM